MHITLCMRRGVRSYSACTAGAVILCRGGSLKALHGYILHAPGAQLCKGGNLPRSSTRGPVCSRESSAPALGLLHRLVLSEATGPTIEAPCPRVHERRLGRRDHRDPGGHVLACVRRCAVVWVSEAQYLFNAEQRVENLPLDGSLVRLLVLTAAIILE